MRIFYICQRVPFPPDRGDKITTYNEIKHLARRHEVHVFCMADGVEDLANVAKVKDLRPVSRRWRCRHLAPNGGQRWLCSLANPCRSRPSAIARCTKRSDMPTRGRLPI